MPHNTQDEMVTIERRSLGQPIEVIDYHKVPHTDITVLTYVHYSEPTPGIKFRTLRVAVHTDGRSASSHIIKTTRVK